MSGDLGNKYSWRQRLVINTGAGRVEQACCRKRQRQVPVVRDRTGLKAGHCKENEIRSGGNYGLAFF
jgi:hypothetical protein